MYQDKNTILPVHMSKQEIDCIKKYLTPETIMLEYGCGGSTLYFSKFVKLYNSIEHDKVWYEKIKNTIKENRIENVNIKLREAKTGTQWTLNSESKFENYENYVKAVHEFNTKKYNFVLIDGRCRNYCASEIYSYVDENSIICVHDFWNLMRPFYQKILNNYKIVESIKIGQSLVILKK